MCHFTENTHSERLHLSLLNKRMSASEAHQCFGKKIRNTDDKWFLNAGVCVFFFNFKGPRENIYILNMVLPVKNYSKK